MVYTRIIAPLYESDEIVFSFSMDVGDVDSRIVRWFMVVLASSRGFRVALLDNTDDQHASWEISLVALESPFNIQCEEGCRDLEISDHTPLTSHETLQSLIDLCNRYDVSHYQLHATLATTLLLSTHNYLNLDSILPLLAHANSHFC